MSPSQNAYYWRLWSAVRKADPTRDRKALHAQASADFPQGLPASHTVFKPAHMDEWIARCKAITEPGNYVAQHEQTTMEATRHRVFIGHLLTALGLGEDYAEAVVARMQRNRRWKYTGAGSGATLADLGEKQCKAVLIALKKECRRVWPKKDDLLDAIAICREVNGLSHAQEQAAAAAALNRQHGQVIADLVYDDLLVVLSALRRWPAGASDFPASIEKEKPDTALAYPF